MKTFFDNRPGFICRTLGVARIGISDKKLQEKIDRGVLSVVSKMGLSKYFLL
jgi:hypothetical protein